MEDAGDLSLWRELFSNKRIAAGLLLLLLLVLAGGGGLFLVQEGRLKQQAEDELAAIARFKIDQIENWRRERLGDGATISQSPFFLQGAGRFLRDSLPDDEGDLRQFFRKLRQYFQYSDAALIGSDKTVRLHSGAAPDLSPWLVQALDQARAAGGPVLTDIHPLSAGGVPHLDVVAPLFAGGEPSGTFLGWLVLQTPAAQFLYPLLQVWPTHSRTAETLLVGRDGDAVVFLNELRHRLDAAPGLRIPLGETEILAVKAVLGARGFVRGRDYRNRDVLGVALPVPGTPWLLISKMDSDEIYAVWRQQALYILALMGCLVGGVVVVALLLRQYGRKAYYQNLYQAEAALRRSREDLKRAQAVAMTGNWRLDMATGTLDWSEESYRIFGVAPGSAMNLERFMDCVHPDDRDMLRRHWEAAMGGERYEVEHRIVAQGEVKWVRERAVLERDAAGSLLYGFGVVQDITEHKHFERFKAVNAARNQALIELADMQAATPDELTQAVLERAVMLTESEFGYLQFVAQDQVHLNLMYWSAGVRPQCQTDRTKHYPLSEAGIWADCLRVGQPVRHNDYARAPGSKGLPQGHIPLVRHLSVPIREGEGYGAVLGVGNKREPYDDVDVGKLQSFVTDAWQILQRKRAVDALRQSEERFRQLVENAPDAIFVLTDGRFVYANQACLALYGMDSPEALLGTPVLERFHPDFHGRVLERMHSVLEQRQVQPPMEQRHVRADGSLLDVEVSAVPTLYGGRDGVMVFVRDIAERKRLEALREDMERIVRHDLKTPLNAILSLPQLLLMDDNLNDEQRQFLGYIMDAGYKMLGLVNLSLDLFRMERGTYELAPARVELLRVVGKALADLEPMRQARKLAVGLFHNGRPADEANACPARAEELLCYSLFSNLIKNALEASPQGATVTLDCVRDKDGWRVDIHNQGETPEAIRDRFFDKYVTMGKTGGTGLGTYSARLMAATMGGAIALDASQAGATTVSVWLPAWD